LHSASAKHSVAQVETSVASTKLNEEA